MKINPLALFATCSLAATTNTHAFQLPHNNPRGIRTARPSFLPRTTIHTNPIYTTSSRTSTTTLQMSTSSPLKIGIVGATGAVGKEILSVIETRKDSFPPSSSIQIFGSSRSAGKTIESSVFGPIVVDLFEEDKAKECDVVFLAVSGDFALEHAEEIAKEAVVIDNSSAFRYKKDIPLCVPEINGEATKGARLVANPNCTTAIGLMALWPLHKLFKLKKMIMSTYQAASGAGQPGMDELQEGTRHVLSQSTPTSSSAQSILSDHKVFAHPLPFNVIPHIDKFQPNLYTKEEMKVTWETRKICSLPDDFPASCTAVRIPTYRAHSESIVIETELPVDLDAARQALKDAPGVKLVDEPEQNQYPMPLTATGQYDIEVGRLRKSLVFGDYGLEFFVCGDQLLRGAALNAVLVAEEMVRNGSIVAKGEKVAA